ncbi:unnamed protein product [marine sediment metagenome]|uniref:Uncharacterized protein n=1 Tax=marine sediment metagenome TaxID=412755 RepID=X1SS58_9ZZZZ
MRMQIAKYVSKEWEFGDSIWDNTRRNPEIREIWRRQNLKKVYAF